MIRNVVFLNSRSNGRGRDLEVDIATLGAAGAGFGPGIAGVVGSGSTLDACCARDIGMTFAIADQAKNS
jgi:hypothetical protein